MNTAPRRLACLVAFLFTSVVACSGSAGHPPKPDDGTGGQSGDGGAGGAGGSGGGGAGGAGGSGGSDGSVLPKDASGGEPDATGATIDGAPALDAVDTMADGASGPDGAAGVAVCWKDPKVIMICHQLENACINCGNGKNPPANTDAVACFELIKKAYAGMATDADCVKFAADHVCKPDDATTTGNVCGGLDCQAPGCKDPAKCEFVKQDGESDKCQPYVATCPCP